MCGSQWETRDTKPAVSDPSQLQLAVRRPTAGTLTVCEPDSTISSRADRPAQGGGHGNMASSCRLRWTAYTRSAWDPPARHAHTCRPQQDQYPSCNWRSRHTGRCKAARRAFVRKVGQQLLRARVQRRHAAVRIGCGGIPPPHRHLQRLGETYKLQAHATAGWGQQHVPQPGASGKPVPANRGNLQARSDLQAPNSLHSKPASPCSPHFMHPATPPSPP